MIVHMTLLSTTIAFGITFCGITTPGSQVQRMTNVGTIHHPDALALTTQIHMFRHR